MFSAHQVVIQGLCLVAATVCLGVYWVESQHFLSHIDGQFAALKGLNGCDVSDALCSSVLRLSTFRDLMMADWAATGAAVLIIVGLSLSSLKGFRTPHRLWLIMLLPLSVALAFRDTLLNSDVLSYGHAGELDYEGEIEPVFILPALLLLNLLLWLFSFTPLQKGVGFPRTLTRQSFLMLALVAVLVFLAWQHIESWPSPTFAGGELLWLYYMACLICGAGKPKKTAPAALQD